MSRPNRVKSNLNVLKINITENQSEPIKFKLMNSGETVSYKILSQKGRKYQIETVYGTILKNHFIEISLDIQIITPGLFNSEDVILIYIYDKESSQYLHTIELPLKVIDTNSPRSQSISSFRSTSIFDSPSTRQRNKGAFNEDVTNFTAKNIQDSTVLSDSTSWIVKKLLFIIIILSCAVVIMLPLRGYPLNKPHPLDNWVIHLARIWPENFLPNHLIQYLAIMILGGAIALFVFLC